MSDDKPTGRQQFNRLNGLGAYAAAVLLTGGILFMIFDEVRRHGLAAFVADIKKSPSFLAIAITAAAIFWAIGFTTARPPAAKP
jgi:hypothetical protein